MAFPKMTREAFTALEREKPEYCQAVTRRQYESATWGGSKIGCSRKAVYYDDGHDGAGWFCAQHRDEAKRYGINR